MPILIVALDQPSAADALALVDRLGDDVAFYKVASPLFTREGPAFVRALQARGRRVFLDLKYHDIPNTVAGAVESAAALGVDLLTLHVAGGSAMLRAAREAAGPGGPRLLGVTMLTSLGADAVHEVWNRTVSLPEEVGRLAAVAARAGLDGVIASPLEARAIKHAHGSAFLVVTPGIRPAGGDPGDQVRTATPLAAAQAGADFIVVGRPITAAPDPVGAARAIQAELQPAQVS